MPTSFFHRLTLGRKQDFCFTAAIGKPVQDIGESVFKQFGIHEKPVTSIHIGQGPAVPVFFSRS
jgi:hypothetical protein